VCVGDTFEEIRMQPTKWDSQAKRLGKRRTKREKMSLLQRYEAEMRQGRNRDQILGEMAREIGVSSNRQVERIIAQAKHYREKVDKHFAELSATALKLAEILGWYYKHHMYTIELLVSSDFPYTTHTPESPMLNERELSNLLAHLGGEIPELVPIGEYPKACEQWFALGAKKWGKQTPSATITRDLISKLILKANQADFTGKCPDCPL
jgi:hypothetical protein